MSYLEKIEAFVDALNAAGIEVDNEDGDTAIVCNDTVVIVTKVGEELGFNFVNRVEHLDHKLGFTREDFEEFMKDAEEAEDNGGD